MHTVPAKITFHLLAPHFIILYYINLKEPFIEVPVGSKGGEV